jgi:hypothetical protein
MLNEQETGEPQIDLEVDQEPGPTHIHTARVEDDAVFNASQRQLGVLLLLGAVWLGTAINAPAQQTYSRRFQQRFGLNQQQQQRQQDGNSLYEQENARSEAEAERQRMQGDGRISPWSQGSHPQGYPSEGSPTGRTPLGRQPTVPVQPLTFNQNPGSLDRWLASDFPIAIKATDVETYAMPVSIAQPISGPSTGYQRMGGRIRGSR